METVRLEKGDVFGVDTQTTSSKFIHNVQKFWSKDGESLYTHSGIITRPYGETFEALPQGLMYSLLDNYDGHRVIIARPRACPDKIEKALSILLKRRNGTMYPFWRLGLHSIPPLARLFSKFGFVVCSELVAEYEYIIGVRHRYFMGTSPDTLADEWTKWRVFDVIFEGVWKAGMQQKVS